MGCCGQGRAAYVPELRPAPAPAPRAPEASAPAGDAVADAGAAPAPGTVRLRFTRDMGVRVRGPVSGLSYAFSGDAPVQAVDARDAEGLLHTGYFRRAF
ncbi:MAG TPA: hypothetical protein VHG08_19485 [Longimicrobium sp.]|nr:hypothetical protein [Longimicrobium sp.]